MSKTTHIMQKEMSFMAILQTKKLRILREYNDGSKILLVGINFFEEIQRPKVSLDDFTMIMYFSHYLGLELSVVQP